MYQHNVKKVEEKDNFKFSKGKFMQSVSSCQLGLIRIYTLSTAIPHL